MNPSEPTAAMLRHARAWRAALPEEPDPDPQQAFAAGMALANDLAVGYLRRRADAVHSAAIQADAECQPERCAKLVLETEILDRERVAFEQDHSGVYGE